MQDWERDYGLEAGERFEPDELQEVFDLTLPHIATLLGPIDPGALGMTVFCRTLGAIISGGEDDPGALLAELETAQYLGLRGLALGSPEESQDENERLHWIAERCPIHLVPLESLQAPIAWLVDPFPEPGFVILDDLAATKPKSLQELESMAADRLLIGLPTKPSEAQAPLSLTDILHAAPLALMNAGYSAADVRTILVENSAAALTITREPDNGRNDTQ